MVHLRRDRVKKDRAEGSWAQYMRYPSRAINYKVPRTIPPEQAALIEPLACAIHAVERGNIQLGDIVGGVVQPGLRVGFDGSLQWGNLRLAREFSFDFQAVKLKITAVSFPAQQTGFAIGLSATPLPCGRSGTKKPGCT